MPTDHAGRLLLSAVYIDIADDIPASLLPYDADVFQALRRRHDLFAFRRKQEPIERQLLVVPFDDAAAAELPAPVPVPVVRNLPVVMMLVEERLGAAFPELHLEETGGGFDHVRRDEDLFAAVLARAGVRPLAALQSIQMHPKLRIRASHEYVPMRRWTPLLTLDMRIAFSIADPVRRFDERGVDVAGPCESRAG